MAPAWRNFLICLAFFGANQLIEAAFLFHSGLSPVQMVRWDAGWYSRIVDNGYNIEPSSGPRGEYANWAFFPVFPVVAWLLKMSSGASPGLSVLLTGKLCFFAAMLAFVRFVRDYAPGVPPAVAAGTIALQPYAIYGNTGYSEPLFLLLTCVFFIALKQNAFLSSGAIGACLGATRLVGLASVPAYLVAAWRRGLPSAPQASSRFLLGLLLLPLGLSLFMVFLHWRTGDALAFLHVQTAWDRFPRNPAGVLLDGFREDSLRQYWAITALAALGAPIWLVRKGHPELAAFSWTCTLLPLSTSLVAMPRFVWWQAPLLMLLAAVSSYRRLWIVLWPAGIYGLLAMYRGWFSGHNFVV